MIAVVVARSPASRGIAGLAFVVPRMPPHRRRRTFTAAVSRPHYAHARSPPLRAPNAAAAHTTTIRASPAASGVVRQRAGGDLTYDRHGGLHDRRASIRHRRVSQRLDATRRHGADRNARLNAGEVVRGVLRAVLGSHVPRDLRIDAGAGLSPRAASISLG